MHNYKDLFFLGKRNILKLAIDTKFVFLCNQSEYTAPNYFPNYQMLTPIFDLYSFPQRASHRTMDYSQSSLAVSPQRISLEDLRESYKPHFLHLPIHMEVEEAEHPSAHRTLGY
ncbi:hypothetical protein PanWU01x14_256110 [Parasponia andersonii]|uniref:Uncharacterized protein n=1 Tax=Parasponia andersonii TaxID=3476 RepID=A0A2P5BAL3_PARAD|nr:hypothetical protein PanWU01x14_256110 [Parasponia andersonii]